MTSSNLKRGLAYLLVVFLGIAAALILYFYQFFYHTNNFLPGVAIAAVPVGGQDRDQVADQIEHNLDQLYQTPVSFYYQGYYYNTNMDHLSKDADAQAIVDDIWEQELNRGLRSKLLNLDGKREIAYYPPIDYDEAVLKQLAQEWNEQFGRPAAEPQLEVDKINGLTVKPGQEGLKVNLDKIIAELPASWDSFESLEVPIIMDKVYPSITEEDLKIMGELSSFSTWYNNGEIDRTHNLTRAAAAVNTKVIQPGEVFSFNETVGARTFESGYRDAMVIVGGKFEPGVGGGICQVSSTLYNAVVMADLEIVERHNHALAVAYVPVGRDATVAYGLQDFRFKNNTAHPIYLRAVTGGGRLSVTVYGHLSYKKRIELSNAIDKVIPFSEVREPDPTLAPGAEKVDHAGIPGYVARSFKTVFDENGQVVDRKVIATDYYKPLNKLIYVGPEIPTAVDPGTGEIPPGEPTEVTETQPGDEETAVDQEPIHP